MTEPDAAFAPDWASPPGDTIADLIEERGWTQAELAERLGYSARYVNLLVPGDCRNGGALRQAVRQRRPFLGQSATQLRSGGCRTHVGGRSGTQYLLANDEEATGDAMLNAEP